MDSLPKPFVKWVGGKGQLAGELLKRAPDDFKTYHEPFMGGAALFFALFRNGRLAGKRVFLSDVNQELVDTYQAIRDDPEKVIARLLEHQKKFRGFEHEEQKREYFYSVREKNPKRLSPPSRAARMIFLNRTGFNGLYRVNSKGKFNVPFGRYKNPLICDTQNLRAVSKALGKVRLSTDSFDHVLEAAGRGDFVYFDPPYVPVSTTANFVSYARTGFDHQDQKRLAETMEKLKAKGARVMLSNSDTGAVRKLYSEKFRIERVKASRRINSKADRRGLVNEVVVMSYEPQGD
ncbi:MAG TPA: DNA adenine methylase [Myxococcota bacterium]|nr:DNA adenine methylase [Myxococcota bacterium]